MRVGFAFLKIIIGIIVVLIIGTIFSNGYIDGFLAFVAASIICTGGVGLVFWIPVVYISGSLALRLFYFIKREPYPESVQKTQPKTPSGPANAVVTEYILKARKSGMIDKDIKTLLLRSGWSEEEIVNSFKPVSL